MWISRKLQAREKCSVMTFIEVDICHRMGPLRMLYRDLDLNFQGHKFETLISRKQWELLHKCKIWLYKGWYSLSNSTFVNVILHNLDLHFQGQTLVMHCYKKLQAADVSGRFDSTQTAPAIELLLFSPNINIFIVKLCSICTQVLH